MSVCILILINIYQVFSIVNEFQFWNILVHIYFKFERLIKPGLNEMSVLKRLKVVSMLFCSVSDRVQSQSQFTYRHASSAKTHFLIGIYDSGRQRRARI